MEASNALVFEMQYGIIIANCVSVTYKTQPIA